jgi:uncharacterized protein YcfJ
MRLLHLTSLACLSMASMVVPALAQTATQTTVVQAENVRLDYAHVLHVEPVYQTLRASRTEMRCEEVAPPTPEAPQEEPGRWTRIVNSVKGVFSDTPEPEPGPPAPSEPECRMVPVQREFRRPIAFDVDYVYKGMKYRSRLAEDPGNRLRIRVSVMPYLPNQTITQP